MEPTIYVVGTFDTKSPELLYLRDCLKRAIQRSAIEVLTVDISIHPEHSHNQYVDISRADVARYHPYQLEEKDICVATRADAISAMARAFEGFLGAQMNVAGIIGLAGGAGTAILAAGLQSLDLGAPKVLVTSLSASDSANPVGSTDIIHINSPCDFKGLNNITRKILANSAAALAGMINVGPNSDIHPKPSICISNNGLTNSCTTEILQELSSDYDCLVFSALGNSSHEMQHLISDAKCRAIFDLAPADITDSLFGGIFNRGHDRFDGLMQANKPYIGSVGSLDSVRFGKPDSLPIELTERQFYAYTPDITLMRTNAQENEHMGIWLAQQLNQFTGPVRLLLPEKGLSSLSCEGQVFYNPEADRILFSAIKKHFNTSSDHKLVDVPCAFNDEAFARALLENFIEIHNL